MTGFLVRLFVKDYEKTDDVKVRERYGLLSSIVGVICNILLFAVKYLMGTLAHSISVISDAFNNLSDCASCVVTLFGYKLAAKPADKDHPFGHGRMEYLTSLLIAVVIIVVGIELLEDSVVKIITPGKIKFSWIVLVSLVLSVGVKLWMAIFNTKLGKKVNSSVMIATAKDSKSDVLATSAVIVALVAAPFTSLPVDGIMGIIVSCFILKSGYDIVKETVDELLGKPADKQVIESIQNLIMSYDKIIETHDMIIHNYGPGNMIGSCHVEVKSDENFLQIHEIVDQIERRIYNELGILMTIHMDPIETDNEQVNYCKNMVRTIIKGLDERLHIHDFRLVPGEKHINVLFDIVVPYDCSYTDEQIKTVIDDKLKNEDVDYFTVITFDREF
ncbi:MAG: cation transporter [Ruminococcus sp.]|nr:cation transporter [Ruminococcus sp.]